MGKLEDQLEEIVNSILRHHEHPEDAHPLDISLIKDFVEKECRKARKEELVEAAPHFVDEPTNFVHYNKRIKELEGK